MAGTRKSNRREEILQALAQMLESTEGASRITTVKLATSRRIWKRRSTATSQVKHGVFLKA